MPTMNSYPSDITLLLTMESDPKDPNNSESCSLIYTGNHRIDPRMDIGLFQTRNPTPDITHSLIISGRYQNNPAWSSGYFGIIETICLS